MTRSLLNKLNTPKALRQALVLFTLLILPSAAWGEETSTTYTFSNAPSTTPNADASYNIVTESGDTWKISALSNLTLANSTPLTIQGIVSSSPYTNSFRLETDFNLTGSFVKAEIVYKTTNNLSGLIGIHKDTYTLASGEALAASTDNSTATINVSSTYQNNRFFINEKIAFTFSFTSDNTSGDITIQSITITTKPFLSVAGEMIETDQDHNFNSGQVSYNKSSKILSLTDATITGPILWGDKSDLEIALSGTNSIILTDTVTTIRSLYKTAKLKFSKNGDTSLKLGHGDGSIFSVISGFASIDYTTAGLYMESSAPTKYESKSINDNATINSLVSAIDGSVIHSATITPLETYPLWVSGVQVNESNATNVLNDGKVSYNDAGKTLTLNGVNLTSSIISSSGQPLTIDLSGENTISCDVSAIKEVSGATTAPDLIFISTDGTGFLRITPGNSNPAISGYNASVASEGLFVDGDYSKNGESVTVAKGYDLQVKGTWVSNANASDVLKDGTSPTVTFDAESNTLTLNGANINDSQIAAADRIIYYKGTENLTIAIKGNTNTAAKIAYSGTGTPKLIFSKAEDGCLLTLERSNDNYNSVIEGFADVQFTNAYFKSAKPYIYDTTNKVLINPTLSRNDIYYNLNQITVTPTVCYKLWINATQVTGENLNDILGDNKATFTAPSTLNLSGISIDNPILNDLDDLEIKISGENSLKASSGTSGYILSINSNAALTLSKGADNSSLSLGNTIGKPAVSGFKSVTLEDGLYLKSDYLCRYVEDDMAYKDSKGSEIQTLTITTELHYPLWVVDRQVTPANQGNILDNDNKTVTFDGTNTLTLNGASISSSSAIESNLDNLVINLKGENSVGTYSTYGYSAICSGKETATLTIAKDPSETGNVTLNLSSGAPVVKGFASVSHEGLYFTSKTGTTLDATNTYDAIISSVKIEPLWIEGMLMTDETTINGTSGTITYNSTDKVLTLNGFQKEYGTGEGQILTGVEGLTIKIVGENNINAAGISILFKALQDNATIKFVGTTADDKLMMTVGSVTNSVFEGFADGAITYENLVYSGGGYGYTIQAPTAPAITVDTDGKIKLAKGYDDGTIYYSIAYADDTPTETDVEYSDPFALTHPATVTAWVVANGTTTSTVTGKYFAYQDAPYKMAINDSKTPVLLPAIAESDPITLSGYASTNGDIATFANGIITAKGPGTATLSVTLSAGDTQFVVLNPVPDSNAPYEYAVTFSVYVGEALGNYFEGSNEYGSFYNETAETYAVPDGMKAYVVTGISGSKLVIEETTVLPPNAVVLLEKGSATTFTKVPATGSAPAGNLLKRATAEIPVTTESSLYVLYQDQYVKVTSGTQIPTGKNYLDLSTFTNAGTRGFYDIGGANDGTSALRGVVAEGTNGKSDAWYTLQGRRLPAKPTKSGLYLLNGKKVVIK